MLTYDEIKAITSKVKGLAISSYTGPYQGPYGTGVLYMAEISDSGTSEPRLANFETAAELENFLNFLRFSRKVVSSTHTLFDSHPTFIRDEQKLTFEMFSSKLEEEQRNLSACQLYTKYAKNRSRILQYKIQLLEQEIKDLEAFISTFKQKKQILFGKKVLQSKLEALSTSNDFDITDIPPEVESQPSVNLADLKVSYNLLTQRKLHLQKQIEVLISISKKNTIQKLLISQDKIDSSLLDVKDEPIDTEQLKRQYLSEESIIMELFDTLHREFVINKHPLVAHFIQTNNDIVETQLQLLQALDTIPHDDNGRNLLKNAPKTLRDLFEKVSKKQIQDAKNKNHSPKEKITSIFEDLKRQHDENLTQEQKDALVVYNSRFFEFINEITSIPDFKTMDSHTILVHLQERPNFNRLIRLLYEFSIGLTPSGKNSTKFISDQGLESRRLIHIFELILPPQTRKALLKSIDYPTSDQKDDNVPFEFLNPPGPYILPIEEKQARFEKIICEIISNLRAQIEIIQNIPEDAIVLPDDLVVYRAVPSSSISSDSKISRCPFVSTSASVQKAAPYGGTDSTIFIIKLKKGTPVRIFPDKVLSDSISGGKTLRSVSPADSNGTKEILIDLSLVQDFEMTAPKENFTHYQLINGEIHEFKDPICNISHIIVGEINPRINEKNHSNPILE